MTRSDDPDIFPPRRIEGRPHFGDTSRRCCVRSETGQYVAASTPVPAWALSKEFAVVNRRSVMVVDGLSETEEVLKAVLEPRGLHVTRVCSTPGSAASRTPDSPSVVVLHEADRPQGDRPFDLTLSAPWDGVPRVVIGRARCKTPPPQGCRYLVQPFQYAELVKAIESLLR